MNKCDYNALPNVIPKTFRGFQKPPKKGLSFFGYDGYILMDGV